MSAAPEVASVLAEWEAACRPMAAGDLEQVDRVERQIYSFPWSIGNFQDSLNASYDAQVLCHGGQLLGYFVATPILDEAHLLNISIAPWAQGQGLGRRLLAQAEHSAAARGARSMLLEVRPSNGVARKLYESTGYAQIGLRRGYYPAAKGREDAIVMRKVFAAQAFMEGACRGD